MDKSLGLVMILDKDKYVFRDFGRKVEVKQKPVTIATCFFFHSHLALTHLIRDHRGRRRRAE